MRTKSSPISTNDRGFITAKAALIAGVILVGAVGGGAAASNIAQNNPTLLSASAGGTSGFCVVASSSTDDSIFSKSGDCGGNGSPTNPGSPGEVVYENDPNPSSIMLTTWDTSLPGCSSLSIPLYGTGGADVEANTASGEIEWGDGSAKQGLATDNQHDYSELGLKQVKITGEFSAFGSENGSSIASCLISVDEWGDGTKTKELYSAFSNTQHLKSIKEIPNTVENMDGAFWYSNFNGPVNHFDTSNVTSMNDTFSSNPNFNQPINDWNVSKVTSTSSMFEDAESFNQPLDKWTTSSLTYAPRMFSGAKAFNQSVNNFDMSKVTATWMMFQNSTAFNQPLNNWKTDSVTDMGYMFKDATAFDQPLNDWNLTKVTRTAEMFRNATSFNQPLEKWNISNVTDLRNMFFGASSMENDLSGWTTWYYADGGDFFGGSKLTNEKVPERFRVA